jgi:hypothetical protein
MARARRPAGGLQAGSPPPQALTVARLVPLAPGFYAFGLAETTRWRDPVAGFALPAVHVAAPPAGGSATDATLEITDGFGRTGAWLGGRHEALFVKTPPAGGAALVTAYLARDPAAAPLELQIRALDGPAAAMPAGPPVTLSFDPAAVPTAPAPPSLEIVAHIRRRGDVRFVDAAWVGRLGPGLWIEAFAILPQDPAIAAAIEYKGLTADGTETAWLGSGARCGTTGMAIPLIGFAVRQKATPPGRRIDCEYSGYFGSGAIVGPLRNGTPCRSARDNDPLEGLQLRIVERDDEPASAGR